MERHTFVTCFRSKQSELEGERPAPRSVASAKEIILAPAIRAPNFSWSESLPPMISHLSEFSRRPIDAPLVIMLLISCDSKVASPAREQSSKYQIRKGETHSCDKLLMARQNNSGPRGSPCWTPSAELSVHLPSSSCWLWSRRILQMKRCKEQTLLHLRGRRLCWCC